MDEDSESSFSESSSEVSDSENYNSDSESEINDLDILDDEIISESSESSESDNDSDNDLNDDFENIKINTSNKIDIGDLKKINRNTLKKKYSKLPNIAKNIIKYYKNVDIPQIPEYNYKTMNVNENCVNKNCICKNINDNNIQILYSQYDKLYEHFVNKKKLRNSSEDVCINLNYELYDNNNFNEQIINNQKTCRYLIEKPKVYESDTVVCNKCKSKKVVFYSLQTRSCDEPMTIFYTCMNCNKKWKG
jgi:DNA-directed RNA polymerase subunit M/transcription elongation factor TFIIS